MDPKKTFIRTEKFFSVFGSVPTSNKMWILRTVRSEAAKYLLPVGGSEQERDHRSSHYAETSCLDHLKTQRNYRRGQIYICVSFVFSPIKTGCARFVVEKTEFGLKMNRKYLTKFPTLL